MRFFVGPKWQFLKLKFQICFFFKLKKEASCQFSQKMLIFRPTGIFRKLKLCRSCAQKLWIWTKIMCDLWLSAVFCQIKKITPQIENFTFICCLFTFRMTLENFACYLKTAITTIKNLNIFLSLRQEGIYYLTFFKAKNSEKLEEIFFYYC